MGVLVNLNAGCKVQDARCRMQRIMHRGSWVRDRKGTVIIQALLILPILILAVFGGYTVWKVASVKQSLHSGTYQATRYLCLNPVYSLDPEKWEEVVEEVVAREVGNNGLADSASLLPAIVTIHGSRLECGLSFTVETWLKLQIGMPHLSTTLTLGDRHDGWVECR
jgi:hypothetical protein